jgi:hypothetical protein
MWLMTTRGFYSVVEHREDDNLLLIRTRCKEDIEALVELIPATPISILDADYSWRIEATRGQWAEALVALLDEVTYPNFKNAIRDSDRHDVYVCVWRQLLVLDDR